MTETRPPQPTAPDENGHNSGDPWPLVHNLLYHGVPVVVCTPSTKPGGDVVRPFGWSIITAEECRPLLTKFRPGVDTLAMVTGCGIDVLDIDVKEPTCGSVANLPVGISTFGEHRTPSGGTHLFVRSTGYATIHGWATSAGPIGDYLGGTPDGGGRALCYLPGSSRPKYPGLRYEDIAEVDLDQLMEWGESDPELVTVLANTGGRTRGAAGVRAATLPEVAAFLEAPVPEGREPCNYGIAALQAMLDEAPSTPGADRQGRHGWCVRSMVRAVELTRGGCLTPAAVEAIKAKLEEIKPKGDTDPLAVLAWSLNNAKGVTDCGLHGPRGAANAGGGPAAPPPVPVFPWGCRPELQHIHDFARSRRVAPLALLGVTLVRAAAVTSPRYVFPPLTGKLGTLNLCVALVGPSAMGKGTVHGAAADVFDWAWADRISGKPLKRIGLGSGEGIAHQYVYWTKAEGQKWLRESVHFDCPEIDQLAALATRQGTTLTAVVREAWSAEALGSAYVDPTKALDIPDLSYRFVLTLGVQPGRAEPLLNQQAVDGGLPQRFAWIPLVDHDAPDEAPLEPLSRRIRLPEVPTGRRVIAVCPEARQQVDQAAVARLRGGNGDRLDGHALYTQLKIAAAMAVLGGHLGRHGVIAEDWALAAQLMAVSDATRADVQGALTKVAADRNLARGKAEGEREIVRGETVAAVELRRASGAILRRLQRHPGEWIKSSALRNGLDKPLRAHARAALAALAEMGQIELEDTTGGGVTGLHARVKP